MRECKTSAYDFNNRWMGAASRPCVGRSGMAHAVAERAAGLRKTTHISYNYLQVKLLAAGIVPLIPGQDVSHLCHDRECTNVAHLVYESRGDNSARNACIFTRPILITKISG